MLQAQFPPCAVKRFSYASERDRPDDRLVDLMIAAESLFLCSEDDPANRGELRYRLALRAAFFIDSRDYSRREVFNHMRKAYDNRSAIVHGSGDKNHRFPREIISHGVWLYYRFCLNYRDVKELLFARGVSVSDEIIRKWCRKFGQQYANQLRRRPPRLGGKWHLDEVCLTIEGERRDLWRTMDQDSHGLDIMVQSRRNKHAAKKFFCKLLRGFTDVPRVIITDQLKHYGAAKLDLLPGVEHRQHRYLNTQAENSHEPTRQQERRLQGLQSPGHAQCFLTAYGPTAQPFRPRRHRLSAPEYRQEIGKRFLTWQDITSLPTAA
jgi:putative transposase